MLACWLVRLTSDAGSGINSITRDNMKNINFAGLVSPGVQLVYGFPWYLPLSVGAGYQWTTPTTSASDQIHLMPHFNAFIAVDIPLFNLFVSRKHE